MLPQTHLHPPNLFDEPPVRPRFWVCVRTKPRCEKRFAEWLAGNAMEHYLPVFRRVDRSYRRNRVFEIPLLPGYVFVVGDRGKADFAHCGYAIDVLRPSPSQASELDRQITDLWRGLTTGSHLELTRELAPGDEVEVTAGALRGLRGRFKAWGTGNRLILAIDVLGVGAALEIPDGSVFVPV